VDVPRACNAAKEIFADVAALDVGARASALESACAGNAALRAEVDGLLALHDRASEQGFMNGPTSRPTSGAPGAGVREGPGTRVGQYKLLQQIGEGGFGVVFMAEQERPVQRRVALKIIKLGMDTRQVVARFEQERQALAIMDHPGIAKVLDAGATETGRPYFVMELVKGEPVTAYCDRSTLTIPERLELFAQVCRAVQHAHTKGIIHRDIKPSNVLVSTQDGKPHAKIIDFGIAKATSAAGGRLTDKTLFTDHHALIGTPEYMSPEQAEGSLDIDTRTDVYSLGVLLYELLTGSTPFDAKTLRAAAYAEVQRIIREVEPPKPSTRLSRQTGSLAGTAAHRRVEPERLGELVKGELDWIVMKALDKDRARRYGSANALADDVKKFLTEEAVSAAPPGRTYLVRKFVKRNRRAVTAVCAIAGVLVLGVIGTSTGLWCALGERAAAQKRLKAEQHATARMTLLLGGLGDAENPGERLFDRVGGAITTLKDIGEGRTPEVVFGHCVMARRLKAADLPGAREEIAAAESLGWSLFEERGDVGMFEGLSVEEGSGQWTSRRRLTLKLTMEEVYDKFEDLLPPAHTLEARLERARRCAAVSRGAADGFGCASQITLGEIEAEAGHRAEARAAFDQAESEIRAMFHDMENPAYPAGWGDRHKSICLGLAQAGDLLGARERLAGAKAAYAKGQVTDRIHITEAAARIAQRTDDAALKKSEAQAWAKALEELVAGCRYPGMEQWAALVRFLPDLSLASEWAGDPMRAEITLRDLVYACRGQRMVSAEAGAVRKLADLLRRNGATAKADEAWTEFMASVEEAAADPAATPKLLDECARSILAERAGEPDRPSLAVKYIQRALDGAKNEDRWWRAEYMDTLALARAHLREFDGAAAAQGEALNTLTLYDPRREEFENRLKAYRAGRLEESPK